MVFKLKNEYLHNSVHLIRYHAYKMIEFELCKYNELIGIGLSISDWNPVLNKNFPNISFRNLPYPEYDIQNLHQIPDNYADVIYYEMILEHIPNPEKAISEVLRILKPGGIVITTTVFIMPYHPCPNDYYRFSPNVLKLMHKDYSAVISGGYGNRRLILAILMKLTRYPVSYFGWNLSTLLTKGNNSKFPIITWAIAKK